MRDIRIEQQKAAILDELIDQAATYCAMWSSNGGVIHHGASIAEHLAVNVFEWTSGKRWYYDGNAEDWAEAEARLRNGECWDLLIGGGE